MKNHINELFLDEKLVIKIKNKLPYLFQLAELDNSRDGKLGMEIGSARERIIIALFIYKFGNENVKTDIGITQAETDVIVFNKPVSIKTITGKKAKGIKLIWTVDLKKVLEFSLMYKPTCDIILVQIAWGSLGHLYLFPKKAQDDVINKIGKANYIVLPKPGTNPRGVEMSSLAIESLITHEETKNIEINWSRKDIEYNAYDRWVEHWIEE
jgi:hypothetical protein